MVTFIDKSNAEKYSVLFDKARQIIGEPISSLNEYFGKLEELVNNQATNDINEKIYFTKLPLDEEYFSIDANTRRITVPTDFSRNGVGVVGDNKAEIVYFQIDRFFDSTDLANNDLNIIIQWEAPDGTTGISGNYGRFIENISNDNNESIQQKVVFGWIIDERMTAAAGRMRFAVHFVQKDSETNELVYALNTLPAELTINTTLNVDNAVDEYNFDEVQNSNLDFLRRITSNGIYDLGSEIPSYPELTNDFRAYEVYELAENDDGDYNLDTVTFEITDADGNGQYNKIGTENINNYITSEGKILNIPENGFAVLKATAKAVIGNLSYVLRHYQYNDEDIDTKNPVRVTSLDDYTYERVSLTSNPFPVLGSEDYYYQEENNEFKKFPWVGQFTVNNNEVNFGEKDYALFTREININSLYGQIHIEYQKVPVPTAPNTTLIEEGHEYYKFEDNAYQKIMDSIKVEYDESAKEYFYYLVSKNYPVDIYEQYVVFILQDIPANRPLVGIYTTDINARAGVNTKTNTMLVKDGITIPRPEEAVITAPITDESIILADGTTTANLSVIVQEPSDGSRVSYQWLKNNQEIGEGTNNEQEANIASSDDVANGYADYTCNVITSKNQASTTIASPTFRVSYPASKPVFYELDDILGPNDDPKVIVNDDMVIAQQWITSYVYPTVDLYFTFEGQQKYSDSVPQYAWIQLTIDENQEINNETGDYTNPSDTFKLQLSEDDIRELGLDPNKVREQEDIVIVENNNRSKDNIHWNSDEPLLNNAIVNESANYVSFTPVRASSVNSDNVTKYYYCILINKFNTDIQYTISPIVKAQTH